jgi:hypothetical protein
MYLLFRISAENTRNIKKNQKKNPQNMTSGGIIKYTTTMISKGFINELLLHYKLPSV